MEPEETAPSKSRKFLKIALWVLAVVTILLGTAYFLTALKNARKEPQPEAQLAPVVQPLTQEEKDQLAKDLLTSMVKDTTLQAEKDRRAKILQKSTPPSTDPSIAEKERLARELISN